MITNMNMLLHAVFAAALASAFVLSLGAAQAQLTTGDIATLTEE